MWKEKSEFCALVPLYFMTTGVRILDSSCCSLVYKGPILKTRVALVDSVFPSLQMNKVLTTKMWRKNKIFHSLYVS